MTTSTDSQPSSTQQLEADRVQDVYLWALTYVGAGVANQAMQEWEASVPQGGTFNESVFLKKIAAMIGLRRSWLIDLSKTYYRLTRGLRTGSTVEMPGLSNANVSVESLRQDFEKVVHEIAAHAGAAPKAVGVKPPLPPVRAEDRKPLRVEKLSGDINEIVAQLADDAQQQINENLANVGTQRFVKKLKQIDTSKPASTVDQQRAEERTTSRNRLAAEAERITLLAARGMAYELASIDKKVKGWVRYSKTGTPCGFCAMLLTRGFTEKSGLYKAERTASMNEVAEAFHTNCHCVAVPIFFKEQLQSSLFDLNREYAELWPKVTEGYGGKEALTVWRRFVKQRQGNTSQPAQEAA